MDASEWLDVIDTVDPPHGKFLVEFNLDTFFDDGTPITSGYTCASEVRYSHYWDGTSKVTVTTCLHNMRVLEQTLEIWFRETFPGQPLPEQNPILRPWEQ